MAGRPVTRRMVADLCELGRKAQLDVTEDGQPVTDHEEIALSYALTWIKGGCPPGHTPTVNALADYLEVSRALLYEWLTKDEGRKTALRVARKDSADFLAEQGLQVLDDPSLKPQDVAIANSRANFRKWLASVFDRANYGQQSAPTVAISVAQMHLHAVEARKQVRAAALPQLPGQATVVLPITGRGDSDQELSAEVVES